MNDNWDTEYKNMWDERYKKEVYVYGKEPNDFFKAWLVKFKPGSILMPADGEGRNVVFAAKEGWAVTSFDLSEAGRSKGLALAHECNVTINYIVGDFEELNFAKEHFDAVGLIYAHVAASKKQMFHHKIHELPKPGSVIFLKLLVKTICTTMI